MNANLHLAQIFIDELARGGLREVCIAPGSRSTPLTLACYHQPALHVTMHLDERSAGFYALGLAQASERPVALVCTSGSAVANFTPAVVEARQAGVPLLLLTADRPHELRDSGANQTMDQVKFFERQALWSVDLPVPQAPFPPLLERHLRTLAARALHQAGGVQKGPVHVNFPFRKPLEPDPGEPWPRGSAVADPPWTRWSRGQQQPDPSDLAELARQLADQPHGLIVCGPRCPGGDFPRAVADLAQAAGWPLLADPLSGLRAGPQVDSGIVLGAYDSFLAAPGLPLAAPQVVLRFGGLPTSAALAAYLAKVQPAMNVHISSSGTWADDDHRTRWFFLADETAFCRELGARLPPCSDCDWLPGWQAVERRSWQVLDAALAGDTWFDGLVLKRAVESLPAGGRLLVGNSLPVRNLDQFVAPTSRPVQYFGNRGLSGIDGNLSTAAGIAAADPARPVLAVVGDLALHHDLNGLYALRSQNLNNLTVLVINNDGGGIFRRLPVARLEPPFTQAFLTPHGLTFEAVARFYGLGYAHVERRLELEQLLAGAFAREVGPRLLEAITDSSHDLALRQVILEQLYASW